MKDILIVGAGGFGREVCGYVEDCIAAGAQWRMKGFLDDNPNALAAYDYPWDIIGSISTYAPKPEDAFLLALGAPRAKKKVAESLLARGAFFEKLVHPTTRLGRNVHTGKGCIFCPQSLVTCDVKMGDFVTFNCMSCCGHDAAIGSWTTLSGQCEITGFARIGEGVFLASGARVKPLGVVGDWSTVGINSAVVMRVKPGVTAFGTPAVTIRTHE